MFCSNCFGSGIVTGLGEYRGVCPVCNGLGREIIVKRDKELKTITIASSTREEYNNDEKSEVNLI